MTDMQRVDLKFVETHCVVGDKITVRSDNPDMYYGNGLYDGLIMTVCEVSPALLNPRGGKKPIHVIFVRYPLMKEGKRKDEQGNVVLCPSGEFCTRKDGSTLYIERAMNENPGQPYWLEVDDEIANRAPVRD